MTFQRGQIFAPRARFSFSYQILNAFHIPGTVQVVEPNKLEGSRFLQQGGYNPVVIVVMKVETGIFREGIMRTNLDQEVREGPNSIQEGHSYQIQRIHTTTVSIIHF